MALISNGTTIASGGSLSVSTTPTTAQVASATAGITSGVVGSYALMRHPVNSGDYENNSTIAGSSIQYSNVGGISNGTASGTWRIHGRKAGTTPNYHQVSVMMRIS